MLAGMSHLPSDPVERASEIRKLQYDYRQAQRALLLLTILTALLVLVLILQPGAGGKGVSLVQKAAAKVW
jgi:ferric-dicitrate binding protein FerR (iron transport regulator)